MRIATVQRISHSISKLASAEAIVAAEDLKARFVAGLYRSKALVDFIQSSDDEAGIIDEQGLPYFSFTFTRAYSSRYTAELTFSLNKGEVVTRCSILQQALGAEPHKECEKLVTFFNIEGLAKTATTCAVEQRVELMQDLGFTMTAPTHKKLIKSGGRMQF